MNQFMIDLPKGRIREFEKKAIMTEKPDFLVPMSFIDFGDKDRVIYKYDGYYPLGQTDHCLTVRETFDYLEKIAAALRVSTNYLIFPERLRLRKETVYIEREKRGMRLVFLPPEETVEPADELYRLLSELQDMYITREAYEYTEMLKEFIKAGCTLSALQNRVVMLKREAYLCGVQ